MNDDCRSCAGCTIAGILASVRGDLAQWLAKWQGKYTKLCASAEDNIEETLTYYRLPLRHKHMKGTGRLERMNQEIKRRTHVVRIFPGSERRPRRVRALGRRDPRELAGGLPRHGASPRA
ncbi:MAG: transposase [Methylocella sp.]